MRLTSFLTLSLMTAAPALAADVSYTIDGENFTGYWAEADNPKGVVLIVHDWDGDDRVRTPESRHAGRDGL
jgi:hypothetical protein